MLNKECKNKKKYNMSELMKLGFTEQQAKLLIKLYSKKRGLNIIGGQNGQRKVVTNNTIVNTLSAVKNFKSCYLSDYSEEFILKSNHENILIPREDYYAKNSLSYFIKEKFDVIVMSQICNGGMTQSILKEVNSGTNVITTINSTNAMRIIDRLLDFELSNAQLMSSSITTLAYQKLLPIVCPHCSVLATNVKDHMIHEDLYRLSALYPEISVSNIRIRKSHGCTNCIKNGSVTVCAEVIDYQALLAMYKKEIKQYIMKRDFEGILKLWKTLSDDNILSDNMQGKTSMEHGLKKVIEGKVSIHDFTEFFIPIDWINQK